MPPAPPRIELWGAQLPAEDGHEDSSDEGAKSAPTAAERLFTSSQGRATPMISDAALELLLRTSPGAINGGESVLRRPRSRRGRGSKEVAQDRVDVL